ncbi:MAG: polysaccharide biosynthesis protein [Christensenellales bacterium]
MKKKSFNEKAKRFFEERKKLDVVAIIVDVILFVGILSLVYWLDGMNKGVDVKANYWRTLVVGLPCLATTILIMYLSNIYRIVWRYAGTMELLRLIIVGLVSLAFGILYRGLFTFVGHPVGYDPNGKPITAFNVHLLVILCTYFGFFAIGALYRIALRLTVAVKHRLKLKSAYSNDGAHRVIVYGAGYTGASLIKRFLENPKDGYVPVAIIDDDKEKQGEIISNVPVEGDRSEIERVIKEYDADIIAIAITEITRIQLRSIFDYIKNFDVRIMIATGFKDADSELNSDTISIRNIKIEDLLHRDEHTMDKALIDSFIKDKVVMVTGGAGSIGSELCRQVLHYGCKKLVIFERHENGMFDFNEELKKTYDRERYALEIGSVRDRRKLREVMELYKPDVVFHAAAYKHVPMMEISADESVKNNVFGTKNVIEQCGESGVKKFILISTDKAINPANVMGATKRVAELCLQNASKTSPTQLAAVRFGNVLGSSGSVIPTFIRQINEGGPVTVTDREMKRYFMTIPEAVRLVLQAGALANGGEVFVLDMGEPVYIYDLAKDLIRMSGLVPGKDIEIKISGLRPGEKLFEELQYGNENVDKTTHKDIFICKLSDIDGDYLEEKLKGLCQASESGDKELTEKLLFELVPSEYRKEHNNKNARV